MCGGPFVDPATLSADVRAIRRRNGCDASGPDGEAQYAILCPVCNGAAPDECEECESEGKLRGFKLMRRCPAHFQTYEVSTALRAYSRLKAGYLPGPGTITQQPASLLEFERVLDDELGRIAADQEAHRQHRPKGRR